MIKKLIGTIAVTLLFAAHANAANISIGGPNSATVGDQFQLTLTGDFFGEGLIAGGISFFWDPTKVQLDNVELLLAVTPDFSCPGSNNCPGDTANSTAIVWGEFLNDLIATDAGPTDMATLTFTAIGAASEADAVFSMMTNDGLTGGWFGAGFSAIPTPTFGDLTMDISATVVPLPAAVWFMIGGLGTLLGFRRK